MKKIGRNVMLLSVAAGILIFSIILMVPVVLLIFTDNSQNAPPHAAGFAVLTAIAIHLVILTGFIKVIRGNKRKSRNRQGEFIGLGILLIIFGLIYMDGAFAYYGSRNTLDLSILMFFSTLCDFIAAIISVSVFYLKSDGNNNINTPKKV